MRLNHQFSFLLLIFSCVNSYGQKQPELQIGGALRFNYNLSTWKEGQKTRLGDFGYDMFRINAKAAYQGVKLNAEYRLYSKGFGGGMLKQGWVGYDFNEMNNLQIGLTQVPFGITQYNSNNWFFNMTYYLGLEDYHDMGIKYTHTDDRWEYSFAFFKNAEELVFGNNSDISDSRYSYDIASIDINGDGTMNFRNKEINQLNGKVAFKLGNEGLQHKIGLSGQYGGLYNLSTGQTGNHYASALHYELQADRTSVKAQIAGYKYNPKNPPTEIREVVAMTAYGTPYLAASRAILYTLCISYSLPVNWDPVSNLQFYNDFGYMNKPAAEFENSIMNVTGILVTAGNVYTYIDAATGRDHPWLGPEWTNALAYGTPNAEWHLRFNINLGYYF
jgi:hypothetical protein